MTGPARKSTVAETRVLLQAYADAWFRVKQWENRLIDDPKNEAKRAKLAANRRAIEQDMYDLDTKSKTWIQRNLPQIYARGGRVAAAAVTGEFTWDTIHRGAVEVLAKGLYTDLLSATETVRDSTRQLVRTIGRDTVLQSVINSQTPVQAARRMTHLIAENGVHAITYSNGAKHGLQEYSRMAVRTVTATAYNQGTLNQAPDVDRWEVLDGTGCGWTTHASPELANGKIVTRAEALSYPISHPNCRRSFAPSINLAPPKDQPGQPLTGDDAKQHLVDLHRDVELTPMEASTLDGYASYDYQTLNDYLRHPSEFDDAYSLDHQTRVLDGIFDRLPGTTEQIEVYRGMKLTKQLDQLKVGSVIKDKAYVSTTTDPDIARVFTQGADGIIVKARMPPGTKAWRMLDEQESEILLQRNQAWRVTKIGTQNGRKLVEVEPVGSGTGQGSAGVVRRSSRDRAASGRISNRPTTSGPAKASPPKTVAEVADARQKLARAELRAVPNPKGPGMVQLRELGKTAKWEAYTDAEKELARAAGVTPPRTAAKAVAKKAPPKRFDWTKPNVVTSTAEKDALYDYAWDFETYIRVNGALRGGKAVPDRLLPTVTHLDRVTNEGRLGAGTLYRTVDNAPDLLKKLKPGAVIDDPAFISTSRSLEKAEEMIADGTDSAVFRIRVREGDRGFVFGDTLEGRAGVYEQEEILLPRGTKFRVVKVSGREPMQVELEIVDGTPPAPLEVRVEAGRRDRNATRPALTEAEKELIRNKVEVNKKIQTRVEDAVLHDSELMGSKVAQQLARVTEATDDMAKRVAEYGYNERELRLSKGLARDPAAYERTHQHGLNTGFYSKCSHEVHGLERAVSHELGHHLDGQVFQLWRKNPIGSVAFRQKVLLDEVADAYNLPRPTGIGKTAYDAWVKEHGFKLSKEVSEYGVTSVQELIAEIWAEYSRGGKAARAGARRVGRMMEEYARGTRR